MQASAFNRFNRVFPPDKKKFTLLAMHHFPLIPHYIGACKLLSANLVHFHKKYFVLHQNSAHHIQSIGINVLHGISLHAL